MRVESKRCRDLKANRNPLEFFQSKFRVSPLYLKLSHFEDTPLNDPHNKRPLIDYYPSARAANGLSLPVCPLFICA